MFLHITKRREPIHTRKDIFIHFFKYINIEYLYIIYMYTIHHHHVVCNYLGLILGTRRIP